MINNNFGYIIGCSGGYLTYIRQNYYVESTEIHTLAADAKMFDSRNDAQAVVNCLTLVNGDRKFAIFRYECIEIIEEIL